MNLRRLFANVKTSWSNRASVVDFARRIIWIYSGKLPIALSRGDWTIGFCYPEPIRNIRLLLRANFGADAFIHEEVFEHQYYRVPLERAPATILDLGANIGLSSIYFSRIFPGAHLACVEPVPGNLRLLKKNLVMNGVCATVFEAAIDPRDGLLSIELDSMDYAHRVARNTITSRKTLKVDALSVPTVLQRLGWNRIGLLKVDIEGHEAALFSHACDWLARVDAICIECHDEFDEDKLQKVTQRFGFTRPRRLPGIWFMVREAHI